MKGIARKNLIEAAQEADWVQVVMNGGPPCFHYERDRKRFCLRAERWDGHLGWKDNPAIHRYISLAEFIRGL